MDERAEELGRAMVKSRCRLVRLRPLRCHDELRVEDAQSHDGGARKEVVINV